MVLIWRAFPAVDRSNTSCSNEFCVDQMTGELILVRTLVRSYRLSHTLNSHTPSLNTAASIIMINTYVVYSRVYLCLSITPSHHPPSHSHRIVRL